MLNTGAIQNDARYTVEKWSHPAAELGSITYRQKDTDQTIIKQRYEHFRVQHPEILRVLNRILKRPPTSMPSPSTNYTFPQQQVDPIAVGSPDGVFFKHNLLNLETMRHWMVNNRAYALPQQDLDILLAFFLDLLKESDDFLNVHPMLSLVDCYFDNCRLKVVSPLINDFGKSGLIESQIPRIIAAGQVWQESFYNNASERKKATANQKIKDVVDEHEDRFNSMVQRCFISAMALATGFDDRSYYTNGPCHKGFPPDQNKIASVLSVHSDH